MGIGLFTNIGLIGATNSAFGVDFICEAACAVEVLADASAGTITAGGVSGIGAAVEANRVGAVMTASDGAVPACFGKSLHPC